MGTKKEKLLNRFHALGYDLQLVQLETFRDVDGSNVRAQRRWCRR
jgi:hypothetical protein